MVQRFSLWRYRVYIQDVSELLGQKPRRGSPGKIKQVQLAKHGFPTRLFHFFYFNACQMILQIAGTTFASAKINLKKIKQTKSTVILTYIDLVVPLECRSS